MNSVKFIVRLTVSVDSFIKKLSDGIVQLASKRFERANPLLPILMMETIMANIGYLKLNPQGVFMGKISTLALSINIALRPVQSDNERAPKFEVMGRNPQGDWVQIGAVYEQFMTTTGEAFLQGSISDPSFATLYFACFSQDDGSYAIAWRAANKRRDVPMVRPEDDGLGESDAELPFDPAPRGRKAKQVDDVIEKQLVDA
jgi:uncharacterized protein (DUF736 family)